MKKFLPALLAFSLAASAHGAMVITEYMYNGSEFIEFTNLGPTAVDMAGWSYSDSAATAGSVDLSGFGVVAAGQSVILSEVDADAFRAVWGLGAGVSVIGLNSQNLGRADQINLYNSLGDLADQLTYGDVPFPGSIRADGSVDRPGTGAVDPEFYGTNSISNWEYSTLSDGISFSAADGILIGSPGVAVIPEPSVAALGLLGAFGLLRRRR